jgi:hypothetical protein
MKYTDLKKKCEDLQIKVGSKYYFIKKLILKGYFDSPRETKDVIREIRLTCGKVMRSNEIQTYMRKFMSEDIIKAIQHKGMKGNSWVLTAYKDDGESKKDKTKYKKWRGLPDRLLLKMKNNFDIEIRDLDHSYGCSGTCTAFLLRKMLEKLIFKVFAKHGKLSKIENAKNKNEKIGLEKMIDIAAAEKNKGVSFLNQRTAKEIKGIKFLGDTAAHNYVTNVDMKTIIPQMPFIITAFEELAENI